MGAVGVVHLSCMWGIQPLRIYSNIGALIVRIGLWGHYTSVGNYLGPYITVILALLSGLGS